MRIVRDPLMQSKLCLLLALVVLIGVLAGGNPFLPCRSPAAEAASGSPAGDTGSPSDAPTYALAAPVPNAPDPAVRLVGDPAALPVASAAAVLEAEECPNAALRADVVQVLHDAVGQPIWVLRDGRALRVDPVTRLLVPVTVDGGDVASKANDASR